MLKQTIEYEDFNGDKVSEVIYFNLTKSEIIEMEAGYEGGLEHHIQRIVEAENKAALISEFKKLLLAAYGVKSDDGKRFVKSDELRLAFSQTAAYDALFVKLATDDNFAAIFIKGLLPKDLAAEVDKAEVKDRVVQEFKLPPPPPL